MNLHGQKYKIKHTQIPRYFLRWMPKITPEEFWVIVALYQIKFFQGPINDLGKSQFNIRSLPIPTKTPSIRMISRWSGLSERKVADIVSQSTICHGLIQKNRHKNGKGKTMSNSFSIHLGFTAQDAWTTYLWFEKELEKDGAEFHLVMEDYIHNPIKPIKALQLELCPEPEKVKPVHEFVDLLCDTFGKYYRYTPEERKEFTQMIELNLFGHQLSISHNFIEIVKEQRSRFANILLLLRSRTYINYSTGEARETIEFKQGYQEISMLTGIPKNTIKNAFDQRKSFLPYVY